MKIEITRSSKPWIKMVTGRHPVYKVDGEFVRGLVRISSSYHRLEITEPGVYQVPMPGKGEVTVDSRRVDTGFIRLAADGTATEITMDEALAAYPIAAPETN